jgi:pyruvate kinase
MMASLLASRRLAELLLGVEPQSHLKPPVSIRKSQKLLRSNSKALFGYRSKGRRTRIMVTLPREAATNYQLVHDLVDAGMNSARINCAHDDTDVWKAMIDHVRTASAALRRNVRISMDLGGPKIRTGSIASGPSVVSFQPDRDNFGIVSGPGIVWLGSPDAPKPSHDATCLTLAPDWIGGLRVGDRVLFRDTRDKERYIDIVEISDGGAWCHAFDRSFLVAGTTMFVNEWGNQRAELLDLPSKAQKIVLKVGDTIVLHRSGEPGEPAIYDAEGALIADAHMACTNQEVFDNVNLGDRVLFDDGKIAGSVEDREPGESLSIRITYAKAEGQKLGADKGINFPDSNLVISGLTQKDREDLAFVVEHADVVNMSFVNTSRDVEDLLEELDRLDALGRIGIILKIETRNAFTDLVDIFLAAMKAYPVGVMIARGDLAVEVGWENMARIQYEVQSLCRAAHLPDVWATQVLENMAKKGLPSRAELTDAATALGAECVMLNKGPYVVQAVKMLDRILKDMRAYQHDKSPMLPVLETA